MYAFALCVNGLASFVAPSFTSFFFSLLVLFLAVFCLHFSEFSSFSLPLFIF
jgi:hypothetical protein